MKTFKILGKYLDQPILVARFKQKVPVVLSAGAGYIAYKDIKQTDKENRKKETIKILSVLSMTVASALLAPKLTNKIFKIKQLRLNEIKNSTQNLCDKFLKENSIEEKTSNIIRKATQKTLKFSEVKHLFNEFESNKAGKEFLDKLIPNSENITSKDIFSEIGRLSLLGIIPVIGGIFGGVLGDKLANSNWKESFPNKIKEGTYQYLANIFLCNIGAGLALALMEKGHVQSKSSRALGMVGGILTTGVIGGSAIANLISNKLINPVFGNQKTTKIYDERKPEALDIGLHVDDIATVGVMSGLKWIEPALPIMYAISGYRAGIGYRNGKSLKNDKIN